MSFILLASKTKMILSWKISLERKCWWPNQSHLPWVWFPLQHPLAPHTRRQCVWAGSSCQPRGGCSVPSGDRSHYQPNDFVATASPCCTDEPGLLATFIFNCCADPRNIIQMLFLSAHLHWRRAQVWWCKRLSVSGGVPLQRQIRLKSTLVQSRETHCDCVVKHHPQTVL